MIRVWRKLCGVMRRALRSMPARSIARLNRLLNPQGMGRTVERGEDATVRAPVRRQPAPSAQRPCCILRHNHQAQFCPLRYPSQYSFRLLSARTTRSSRSISAHRRPRISPRLIPVVPASRYMAQSALSAQEPRELEGNRRRSSWKLKVLRSMWIFFISPIPAVGSRSSSSLNRASRNTVFSTPSTWLTLRVERLRVSSSRKRSMSPRVISSIFRPALPEMLQKVPFCADSSSLAAGV